MENVAVSLKVFADDPAELESIKKAVGAFAKIQYSKDEEIGFGIKILRITILVGDSEGGTDKLEQQIASIPHVSQVEVEKVTRI